VPLFWWDVHQPHFEPTLGGCIYAHRTSLIERRVQR